MSKQYKATFTLTDHNDIYGSGVDGKGIVSTTIEYKSHTSGTEAPSGEWFLNIPVVNKGNYLWTRTTIVYTEGEPSIVYSVSYVPLDGEKGDTGPSGDDGDSLYTWVQYADFAPEIGESSQSTPSALSPSYLTSKKQADQTLYSINNVYDEITSSGNFVQRVQQLTLRGHEDWVTVDSGNSNTQIFKTTINDFIGQLPALSSHAVYKTTLANLKSSPNTFFLEPSGANLNIYMHFNCNDVGETIDAFKFWLLNNYFSDSPLIIYYALKEIEELDLGLRLDIYDSPIESTRYIGIAVNQENSSVSKNRNNYDWSRFYGEDPDALTTWVMYADSPTTGISEFPDGKKYIGLAFNKQRGDSGRYDYSTYDWHFMPQNIEIGGRNLILESNTQTIISDFSSNITVANPSVWEGDFNPASLTKGDSYVLSQELISNTKYTLSIYQGIDIPVGVWVGEAGSNSEFVGFLDSYGKLTFSVESHNLGAALIIKIPPMSLLAIELIKLELGNVSTDWTPAPEDFNNQIEDVKDGIERLVTKHGELVASMEGFDARFSSVEDALGNNHSQILDIIGDIQSDESLAAILAKLEQDLNDADIEISQLQTNFADLSTSATGLSALVGQIQSDIDAQESELDSISTLYANLASWKLTAEEQLTSFLTGGGTNLIRNSVGYGYDVDTNKFANWKYSPEGLVLSSKAFSDPRSVSQRGIYFNSNGSISQTINVQELETYSLSMQAQTKNIAGVTATLSLLDKNYILSFSENDAVYEAFLKEEISMPSKTQSITIVLTVAGATANNPVIFSDLILAKGQGQYTWEQANGETYSLSVRMDSSGIRVGTDLDNEEAGSYSTVMTPQKFAGYYGKEEMFTLNESTTEVSELKVKKEGITMNPIKIQQNENSIEFIWIGSVSET